MKTLSKAAMLLIVLTLLPAFGSGARLFTPTADLWDRWTAHDAVSTTAIDHGAWTALLQAHVAQQGQQARVDYTALSAERAALQQYIAALAATPISRFNRAEQLAYWINLYNAVTIDIVLQHLPVDSIRDIDISPGLLSDGPWGKELVTVEGTSLSLNDIEHRILRPIWRDPRIHYAVNCASVGCPDLRDKAYSGAAIDHQLDGAARDYVNDARGVSITGGKITVSAIYDWFIEDFGGSEQGVIAHLTRYADPELSAAIGAIGALDGTHYDWSLNAQ